MKVVELSLSSSGAWHFSFPPMYIPTLGRLELDERCQRSTPSSVSAAGIISSNFLELPTAVTRHVCTHTATMVSQWTLL